MVSVAFLFANTCYISIFTGVFEQCDYIKGGKINKSPIKSSIPIPKIQELGAPPSCVFKLTDFKIKLMLLSVTQTYIKSTAGDNVTPKKSIIGRAESDRPLLEAWNRFRRT